MRKGRALLRSERPPIASGRAPRPRRREIDIVVSISGPEAAISKSAPDCVFRGCRSPQGASPSEQEEAAMKADITKTSMKQRALDLIAGTQKHAPNGPLTLGSTSFTAQSLEQAFQSLVDAIAAADAARAAWHAALGKMKATGANVVPVMQDYAAWVAVTYRSTATTLSDFGVAPRKVRTPLTTSAQAVAVAKRVSTRAARSTMGSVQKKAVKG